MALALPAPLKERLIELLEGELSNVKVFADDMISTWSLRGLSQIKSLPDKGPIAEQLRRFIGDDPFSTFVIDELDASFIGPGINLEAGEVPLTSYEGYGNLQTVAADLVRSFCTLPWSYRLTVGVPSSMGAVITPELGDIVLSPGHRIVSGTMLAATFPLPERPQGLAVFKLTRYPAPHWEDQRAYLQVSMSGYFRSKQTEPYFAARDDVLTFFGLGIALGLFADPVLDTGSIEQSVADVYIHRLCDGAWKHQGTLEIDDHHRRGIGRLRLAAEVREDPTILREKLERIGSVFRSETGKGIALSARWLFESFCGRDALLQYIQAAVAIEVLLGDEEADASVGLTTLMANRCAFLIAKTPAARTNLLKLFRDIYKVRSKIVHRGKSRLTEHELKLFRSLHVVLRAVIDNEQRLIERAEQRTQA